MVAAVPPQTIPQPPQLLRSVWVFRQMPLQLACPTAHRHEPATQNWLAAQSRLQAPQWLLLDCRSVHTPPQ
jgi:hypothetical protein